MADPDIDAAVHADLRSAFAPDMLAELFGCFLDAADRESAAIRAAQAQGDRDAVERAAHRLVSAAAQHGFPVLAEAARRIEHGAARGDGAVDEGLDPALARARARARRIIEELTRAAARGDADQSSSTAR